MCLLHIFGREYLRNVFPDMRKMYFRSSVDLDFPMIISDGSPFFFLKITVFSKKSALRELWSRSNERKSMFDLFETSDYLNLPIECFHYNAKGNNNFPVKLHWHYYMELIYVKSGSAVFTCDEEKYRLSAGNLIVLHPKTVHSIASDNPSGLAFDVLKFDIGKVSFDSDYAPQLRSIFKSAHTRKERIVFDSAETEEFECSEIMDECISEANGHEYGYDAIVKSNIFKLLMKILRTWQAEGFQINNEIYSVSDEYSIDSITEYIDSHTGDNLKVFELAKKCGMSYSYFAKSFHQVYGKSCKEYIEGIRIYKAELLLLFTDFDLNYISQETGFSDCSHLIKSFKALRGETPAKYRKRHSNS